MKITTSSAEPPISENGEEGEKGPVEEERDGGRGEEVAHGTEDETRSEQTEKEDVDIYSFSLGLVQNVIDAAIVEVEVNSKYLHCYLNFVIILVPHPQQLTISNITTPRAHNPSLRMTPCSMLRSPVMTHRLRAARQRTRRVRGERRMKRERKKSLLK